MNLLPFWGGIILIFLAVLSAMDCKYIVSRQHWNAPFRKALQQGAVLPYALMGVDGVVVGMVGSEGRSYLFWAGTLIIFLVGLLLLRRNWKKYCD